MNFDFPLPITIIPFALLLGVLNYMYWKRRGFSSMTYLVGGICLAYIVLYQLGKIVIS